jgi:hypothetical protein
MRELMGSQTAVRQLAGTSNHQLRQEPEKIQATQTSFLSLDETCNDDDDSFLNSTMVENIAGKDSIATSSGTKNCAL